MLLTQIGQPSRPCFHDSLNPQQLLLHSHSLFPSWFSSDPPRLGKPKTHVCLFCTTIGYQHLYSPLRNCLGAQSLVVTWVYLRTLLSLGQPGLIGLALSITIHSHGPNLNTRRLWIISCQPMLTLPASLSKVNVRLTWL